MPKNQRSKEEIEAEKFNDDVDGDALNEFLPSYAKKESQAPSDKKETNTSDEQKEVKTSAPEPLPEDEGSGDDIISDLIKDTKPEKVYVTVHLEPDLLNEIDSIVKQAEKKLKKQGKKTRGLKSELINRLLRRSLNL